MTAKAATTADEANKHPNPVDTEIRNHAITALLKHHESQKQKTSSTNEKKELFDSDNSNILVQFTLTKVPGDASPKPIRIPIPHPLHKILSDKTDDDMDVADDYLSEVSICIIVKESSKPFVQSMIDRFPEHMGNIKKVLGLDSLRKKYERFNQKRELMARYDLFMADERILPMLSKCLGKTFFQVKKQPIPLSITRKEALPFAVERCLRATYMFKSAGTCITVRAGNTGMPLTHIQENCESVIREASQKIPKKWANIMSIFIKTSNSVALPIYNKTPEEMADIASLSKDSISKKRERKDEEKSDVVEVKKDKKLKVAKSPLARALKKQKATEDEPKKETSGKNKRKKSEDDSVTAITEKKEEAVKTTKKSIVTEKKAEVVKTPKNSGKNKRKMAEDDDVVEEKQPTKKVETPVASEKKTPATPEKKEEPVKTPKAKKSSKKVKKSTKKEPLKPTNTEDDKVEEKKSTPVKQPKSTVKKSKKSKQSPSEEVSKEKSDFLPAKKFTGAKKGYAFLKGKKGVGYYVDVVPVPDKAALAALTRAFSPKGGKGNSPKGGRSKSRSKSRGRR